MPLLRSFTTKLPTISTAMADRIRPPKVATSSLTLSQKAEVGFFSRMGSAASAAARKNALPNMLVSSFIISRIVGGRCFSQDNYTILLNNVQP